MYNKKLLPASLAAALFAGAVSTAQAAPEISGNVALTSDYRFRGISQTDESPAIQGGFDISWDNGIYLGAWGSNVDFDSNFGYDGSLELDFYGGWAGDITDNVGVDVGYLYYDYSVGVTASWLAVDWTLAYVGTDLDKEDVFDTDWGADPGL